MTAVQLIAIPDWRVRDEDALPDVLPNEGYERLFTPQAPAVVRRILVRDLHLVRLQIGNAFVPFKIDAESEGVRTYRPDVTLLRYVTQLLVTGARVRAADAIEVVAGMDVRLALRNESAVPAKPRAVVLVEMIP